MSPRHVASTRAVAGKARSVSIVPIQVTFEEITP
jgi:hypothetical protein